MNTWEDCEGFGRGVRSLFCARQRGRLLSEFDGFKEGSHMQTFLKITPARGLKFT